ncbi:hypothetical protein GCM10025880_11450 [Methylorubrum aminovorans]|nr:hypothetical protein GCM10025880_11450 [Methylorubrum aminovorans]
MPGVLGPMLRGVRIDRHPADGILDRPGAGSLGLVITVPKLRMVVPGMMAVALVRGGRYAA